MDMNFVKQSMFGLTLALVVSSCGTKATIETPNVKKAVDPKNMDLSIDPKQDFNLYANDGWKKNHPIPAEKGRYGAFDVLRDETDEQVKTLVKSLAEKGGKKGSLAQKVGTFYNLGMDIKKRDAQGISPISERLSAIVNIKSKSDVETVLIDLHNHGIDAGFVYWVMPDAKNSEWNIGYLFQSGLGLPDRDYYLAEDERSASLRVAYVDHIQKMFVLIGENTDDAAKIAQSVMAFETRLAHASLTRIERRDPIATYNKMNFASIQKAAPALDWAKYFEASGITDTDALIVDNPKFLTEVSTMLEEESMDAWRNYLRWGLLNNAAAYLSSDIDTQNFEFYGKELTGKEAMEPLWKRVQGVVSGALSEGIGQLYVEKYFPPAAKKRMVTLVENLRIALGQRIENLDWMGDATKLKAKEKLDAITVKVGYPDKWKDYTALRIEDDSYVANQLRSNRFQILDNRQKLGKKVDKTEWGMSPQTVNAYYNPLANEIVFPAGILQPPFFYMDADDAVNYGAIGVVIGHEMTHGFDDQGCKYTKEGNLENWWTEEDAKQFEERTQVLVEQFDNLIVYDTIRADGKLSLGENIADLGGLNISYQAFMNTKPDMKAAIDGFTPAQRFYISYSNVWAQNVRKKEMLRLTKEDVHSLGHNRILGPLKNLPAFHAAFDVKEGDAMYLPEEERAIIW